MKASIIIFLLTKEYIQNKKEKKELNNLTKWNGTTMGWDS